MVNVPFLTYHVWHVTQMDIGPPNNLDIGDC